MREKLFNKFKLWDMLVVEALEPLEGSVDPWIEIVEIVNIEPIELLIYCTNADSDFIGETYAPHYFQEDSKVTLATEEYLKTYRLLYG